MNTLTIETHTVPTPVLVYRADLIPDSGLPRFIKMIEIEPIIAWVKAQGYPLVGFYATRNAYWAPAIVQMSDKLGIKCIIGVSNIAEPPDFYREIPQESLYRVKPNLYRICHNATKKYVESLHGYMIPFGLDHPVAVQSVTKLFEKYPIPEAGSVIVPTGTGVVLASVLQSVPDTTHVYGISVGPPAGVRRVVQKYVTGAYSLTVLNPKYPQEILDSFVKPFPMHDYYERRAYIWLTENIGKLKPPVVFMNLGS